MTNSGIAAYSKQLGGGSGVTAAGEGNSGVLERQALTLACLNRSAMVIPGLPRGRASNLRAIVVN